MRLPQWRFVIAGFCFYHVRAAKIRQLCDTILTRIGIKQDSAPQLPTVAYSFMKLRCFVSFTERFPNLLSEFGHKTLSVKDIKRIQELVVDVWTISDRIEQRSNNYNPIKKRFAPRFSSSIRAWTQERTAKLDELATFGFPYELVQDKCQKFSRPTWDGDETRTCALEWANGVGGQKLEDLVRIRLDAEEYQGKMFPSTWVPLPRAFKYRSDQQYQSTMTVLNRAKVEMEGMTRESYSDALMHCRQKTRQKVDAMLGFIADQLISPAHKHGNVCYEVEGKLCPEGTAPTTKRSTDVIKGTLYAFIFYMVANVVLGLGGSIVGGILGLHAFGPGGLVGGMVTGFGTVVGPIDECIAAAAFFWFSIGPNKCACFPRSCYYDNQSDSCAMDGHFGQPSRNPFARALPYQGLKCGIDVKNPKLCVLSACTANDFTPETGDELYGKVGRFGQEMFNCLSKTRLPTSALSIERKLPNGHNNTVEFRNELFKRFNIGTVEDNIDAEATTVIASMASTNAAAEVEGFAVITSTLVAVIVSIFVCRAATFGVLYLRTGAFTLLEEPLLAA